MNIEEYKGSTKKIDILCKKHNSIFKQMPNKHLIGRGCPICGRNIKIENSKEYIKKFKSVYGNRFEYFMDKEKIYSTLDYIDIRCKKHDIIFKQKIYNHIHGAINCDMCNHEKTGKTKSLNKEVFLKRANEKFKNNFKYDLSNYKNANSIINITCPEHGVFEQRVNTHLRAKIACPQCKKIYLRLKRIQELTENEFNGYQVIPNFNPKACDVLDKISEKNNIHIQHAMNGGEFYIKELGYWVDGYDKENNVVYEFDEKKHFTTNAELKEKDVNRQQEIENHLRCKFIRIDDNDVVVLKNKVKING